RPQHGATRRARRQRLHIRLSRRNPTINTKPQKRYGTTRHRQDHRYVRARTAPVSCRSASAVSASTARAATAYPTTPPTKPSTALPDDAHRTSIAFTWPDKIHMVGGGYSHRSHSLRA